MSVPRAHGQLLSQATDEQWQRVNDLIDGVLAHARREIMRDVRCALTHAYTEGVRDGYAQAVIDAERLPSGGPR